MHKNLIDSRSWNLKNSIYELTMLPLQIFHITKVVRNWIFVFFLRCQFLPRTLSSRDIVQNPIHSRRWNHESTICELVKLSVYIFYSTKVVGNLIFVLRYSTDFFVGHSVHEILSKIPSTLAGETRKARFTNLASFLCKFFTGRKLLKIKFFFCY